MFSDSHSTKFQCRAESWDGTMLQQFFSFSWVWIYFRIGLNMEVQKHNYAEAVIFHPTFSQRTHVSGVLW